MEAWVFDVLCCAAPGCSGKLRSPNGEAPKRDGIIRCGKCKTEYPVLGGIPILVPAADEWVAAYREAILSSLAEAHRLTRTSLTIIDEFTRRVPRPEPLHFGDDWVPNEKVKPPASRAEGGSDDVKAFDAFLAQAAKPELPERLLEMLGGRALGTVLELGPGVGNLSKHLRHHAKRLIVADISLRATLRALRACGSVRGKGAPVEGAVVDAEQLPLRRGGARTVVAANIIDLLDHPAAFLSAVADGLPKNGRLLLSTPAPDFAFPEGDAEILDGLVERSGLRLAEVRDGLPWIRANGPRHYEVFFVRAVLAEHA